MAPAKRGRICIDEPNQYFSYDQATHWAETMTTRADIGFAQDVIPQGSIATPTRGSDAHLVCGEWGDPQVTCHDLARRQSHTLSSLQVTNRERMIDLDFGFTSDSYRQLNQGLYKLSINLLGSLCRHGIRRVEE